MLQIFEHGIKPHIRVNGFWNAWEPEHVGLQLPNRLKLDDWYRFDLECDKSTIRIRIVNLPSGIQGFDREWKIPSGQIAFRTAEPSVPQQPLTSPVPFAINLEFGTVGFRNHSVEKAAVRNVLVQKL
jgi:hypothetical protein